MHIDVMTQPAARGDVARLAEQVAGAGFSGLVFTEMSQPPWLSIATAHDAAPELDLLAKPADRFGDAVQTHRIERRYRAITAEAHEYVAKAKRLARQPAGFGEKCG